MLGLSLKKLAKNYMHIWDAGCEGLLDVYADDSLTVEYTHFDRVYKGIEDYKTILKTTHEFFPDLKITLGEVITDKRHNHVTLFWNYAGTHENKTLFGVEPTGKKIAVNGMTVLTVKKNRVVREKGIADNLNLIMQLNEGR